MKRNLFTVFLSILLFTSSAINASCDKYAIAGSYVANMTTSEPNIPNELYQLQLHADGTAYFNESSFTLAEPLTNGAQTATIGTWGFLDDEHIIVTTIGGTSVPIVVQGINDIITQGNFRVTLKLKVKNKNTLVMVQRIFKIFGIEENPNTASGQVVINSCAHLPLKRVKLQFDDLIQCP